MKGKKMANAFEIISKFSQKLNTFDHIPMRERRVFLTSLVSLQSFHKQPLEEINKTAHDFFRAHYIHEMLEIWELYGAFVHQYFSLAESVASYVYKACFFNESDRLILDEFRQAREESSVTTALLIRIYRHFSTPVQLHRMLLSENPNDLWVLGYFLYAIKQEAIGFERPPPPRRRLSTARSKAI